MTRKKSLWYSHYPLFDIIFASGNTDKSKKNMRILYNIYQVCFALPVLLVLTILTALVTIVGSLIGGAHFWGYYPGKIWSRLTCYLLLIPVEVKGREKVHKHTSYVFVPNHQGAFDIFLIYGFLGRNFKWMMKKSLRKIPFVGKACESAGHIFVDRSNPKKILATMRQAESSLTNGVSLVVFPEGARTFTGHMGYFKRGAFQLADDLQLAVVPVTIDGSFEILPRTGKWIHRHRLILTIHDPIPPKGKGPENIKATLSEAYAAVESALPERYKGMVKNLDQEVH
jgi:1-acyl-sn-glycerol-3-phosphate acyltransferase